MVKTPKNLDVLGVFYGRKKVCLGVNGNPEYITGTVIFKIMALIICAYLDETFTCSL